MQIGLPVFNRSPEPVDEDIRRADDIKNDLWTTFNRVQKSLMKSGLRGRAASGNTFTTRAATGVDHDVKFNRALRTLAEEMRKLGALHKTGADIR